MTTIHFVRHGEVHNPQQVFYARLPRFRLSERGRGQAAAAARYLKERPIAAVFSSPMLRARQTAQLIAAEHNIPVKITQLLNEIHTPYQGTLNAEMDAIDWRLYENIDEQYEKPEHLVARIQKFINRVLREYPGKEVVAVTHGDILLHARMWAESLPLTHEARRGISPYPITASINTLHFKNGAKLPTYTYHEPYKP